MWQLCHLYQRLSEEEKDVLDATQPIQKSCWCYEGMELLITPLTLFTHLHFTILYNYSQTACGYRGDRKSFTPGVKWCQNFCVTVLTLKTCATVATHINQHGDYISMDIYIYLTADVKEVTRIPSFIVWK